MRFKRPFDIVDRQRDQGRRIMSMESRANPYYPDVYLGVTDDAATNLSLAAGWGVGSAGTTRFSWRRIADHVRLVIDAAATAAPSTLVGTLPEKATPTHPHAKPVMLGARLALLTVGSDGRVTLGTMPVSGERLTTEVVFTTSGAP